MSMQLGLMLPREDEKCANVFSLDESFIMAAQFLSLNLRLPLGTNFTERIYYTVIQFFLKRVSYDYEDTLHGLFNKLHSIWRFITNETYLLSKLLLKFIQEANHFS